MSNFQSSPKVLFCLGLLLSASLVPIPTPVVLAQSSQIPVSSTRSSATTDYLLGPGDQIQIEVFEYEEFKGKQTILPDGTITLPIAGQLTARGLTIPQLTQKITKKLNTYLVDPAVTVTLSSLRPLMINVVGEVYRPGPTQLVPLIAPAADSEKPMLPTMTDALTQAGGVTNLADVRQIMLKRFDGQGREEVFQINLWEAIQGNGIATNPILRDGDALVVPRALTSDPLEQRLVARSTLSPNTIKVKVIGEVLKPGEVEVRPDSSIADAVAIAGGPTDKANLKKVRFARLASNGTVQQQELNIKGLKDDQQVQNGDVVVIPKQAIDKVFDTADKVLSPFSSFFSGLFILFR
jgi:polysaccharide biosynthesis/export protein